MIFKVNIDKLFREIEEKVIEEQRNIGEKSLEEEEELEKNQKTYIFLDSGTRSEIEKYERYQQNKEDIEKEDQIEETVEEYEVDEDYEKDEKERE